ncbi:hypothetical protein ACE6H2_027753 [Prunus campanulata]
MGTYDSIDLLLADWCWGIVIIHVRIWGESVLLYSDFVVVLSGITSFRVETDNSSFKKYTKMPDNMWNCYYQFCVHSEVSNGRCGPHTDRSHVIGKWKLL